MSEPVEPILINASSTPAQVQAAVGQIVPVLGGIMLAWGILTPQKVSAVLAVLPIGANVIWRVYVAWRNHERLKIAGLAAPDAVAQVVSGKQELRT